jgi:hypothetical protein
VPHGNGEEEATAALLQGGRRSHCRSPAEEQLWQGARQDLGVWITVVGGSVRPCLVPSCDKFSGGLADAWLRPAALTSLSVRGLGLTSVLLSIEHVPVTFAGKKNKRWSRCNQQTLFKLQPWKKNLNSFRVHGSMLQKPYRLFSCRCGDNRSSTYKNIGKREFYLAII